MQRPLPFETEWSATQICGLIGWVTPSSLIVAQVAWQLCGSWLSIQSLLSPTSSSKAVLQK